MMSKIHTFLLEKLSREKKNEFENDETGVSEEQFPSSSTESITENRNEPILVEILTGSFPKTDFEPVEKQRHFGILNYKISKRFRKMMIIGLVNVIMISALFLFIFLFVELHKGNVDDVEISTTTTPSSTLLTTKITTLSSTKTTTRTTMQPSTSYITSSTTTSNGYCREEFTKIGNKCLKLVTKPYDHVLSERFCTEENEEMKAFINGTVSTNIWIGISCFGNTISECILDDTSTVEFNNFAKGYPDYSKGACVSYLDEKWYSVDCSEEYAHICDLPMNYHDSDGCDLIFEDNCYDIIIIPKSFNDALKHCQDSCSQLTSIHSAEEDQYIRTMMSTYVNGYYAIGGYAPSKDYIIWIDRTPADFNNIDKFNGEGCLFMSSNSVLATRGQWFTGNCSIVAPFVCKRLLGATCATARPSTSCSAEPLRNSGTFSSPNFPYPYPPFTNCSWTLITAGPQKIDANFFPVRVGDDSLRWFDGDSRKGLSRGYITEQTEIKSGGNVIFITFETGDNSARNYGFNASFKTVF